MLKSKLAAAAVALAAILPLSACGGDPTSGGGTGDASSPAITIGSANFPENQLLAEMYAQALEAKGVKVTRKFNIGARELYLKPVMTELTPLLGLLFDDVSITFDDKSLLPHAIRRNGQEEDVDRLSGGMREQLSVLTRLAFARLLARDGRRRPSSSTTHSHFLTTTELKACLTF